MKGVVVLPEDMTHSNFLNKLAYLPLPLETGRWTGDLIFIDACQKVGNAAERGDVEKMEGYIDFMIWAAEETDLKGMGGYVFSILDGAKDNIGSEEYGRLMKKYPAAQAAADSLSGL
jgi:hypothetical protein